MHNLPNLRPSRRQRLLRRLWRRRHPHLRYPPKACRSHGSMLAKAQAVDHQRAYAARWVQGADKWVKEWRGEAVGYQEG